MSTSTNFVSVKRVVATAKSIIEDADTADRAFFDEWVYLGLLEIGPNQAWLGECTLYPMQNLTMLKPNDFFSAISLGLFNASGQELRYTYRGQGVRTHLSGNSTLDMGTYAPEFGAPIDLSEDQYYFHLGSNGTSVNYALLEYLRFPVDENGNMLIPEEDVLPLSYFLKYMWYCRKDDKTGMGQWNNKWIAARNEARGAHRIPTVLQGAEIARTWNSLIQKMRFKTF